MLTITLIYIILCHVLERNKTQKIKAYDMREWLSGGVSPCQGEGRGFESRLALNEKGRKASKIKLSCFFAYKNNVCNILLDSVKNFVSW